MIPSQSTVEHPDAVGHVGTCQRWYEGGQGKLVAGLGIESFAIHLPTADPGRHLVKLRQFGGSGTDHGHLGGSHGGQSGFHIHHTGRAAVDHGRTLVDQLAQGNGCQHL